MIEPAFKEDWFVVDKETASPLFEVPGVVIEAGATDHRFRVHRSHLVLLPDEAPDGTYPSEAVKRLVAYQGNAGQPAEALKEWARRNEHTASLGFQLKTVQHQAVDFIQTRHGTLLADEMRVGKTLSAAYSHDPDLGKLVVIAPLMVREVWLSWMRRIWPDTEIGVMIGRKFDPEAASKPLVFGHYDILPYWQSGRPIGTLVLDEAHVLMNRNTARSRAAILLANQAERVIAATGTPIWNMPPGLWNILALVAPGAFGGYHEFCQRYGAPVPTPYGNKYTGISNGEELSKRLTEVMIRRRWIDVQQDLPPITRNVLTVDLSLSDRRKLDIRAESLRKSERTNTAAELARYREALSMLKMGVVVAQAEAFVKAGEPVVIWCWHRSTADQYVELLVGNGFEALAMHGESPIGRRERIIEHWRSLPAAALVVTMSVAQVGINLAHSSKPIFAEIDYTPAMISQAEMRTFDPTRAMNVTYVVADHFADRAIIKALTRKLGASEPVQLGTGEGAIGSIDRAFRGEDEAPDMDRFMADLLGG